MITGLVGDRTLQFSSAGLTSVTSNTIDLTAGVPTQLTITTQPSASAPSGSAFGQQPTIQLRDSAGNAVSQSGVSITAAIQTGAGTLGGTLSATTNASGLATFTDLMITGTVGSRTLQFSSAGLTSVTSSTVDLTAGVATQLTITTQPSASAPSGSAFGQQPAIQLRDSAGNAVSQSGVSITAAIVTGGGTLGGTTPVLTNGSGIATFTNLMITGLVGNRTLQFSSAGLTSVTSNTINITAGAPTQLVITTQPSASAPSGSAFGQQPAIQLRDASGNAVSQSGVSITAAIVTGGGTLGGTTPVLTNGSGIATFTNLMITGLVGDRTLQFSSAGLTSVTSSTINITAGVPTQLAITTQPVGGASGASLATQPVVEIRDAQGNRVTTDKTTQVTAAIQTGGGTLGGTTSVLTSGSGVATFTNLMITGLVGSRTLQFSSAGLTSVTSSAINITVGTATQLAITTQPVGGASGASLATQPVVEIRDAQGNRVTTDNTTQVTVAIQSGAGGTLGGTTTVTASSGVVTFAGLTLTGTVGENYVLRFTATGLTLADSNNVTVTAGTATQLAITTQPVGGASGASLATQPVVEIRDAQGNRVTTDNTTQVTVAIQSGAGGTLGGTTTVTASSGVVTFAGLTLTGTVGENYVLRFTATGLTLADSNNVTVTAGTATQLAITTQPVGGASGASLATQPVVEIRDAQGNRVTTDNTTQVTVAIQSGAGGTLGGTTTVTASSGVVTFAGLTLTGTVGENYVLRFTATGLTLADSNNVTLIP